MLIVEDGKRVFKLNEYIDSEKLKKFLKRHIYDLALKFCNNKNYAPEIISNIHKLYGDYSFKKGEYQMAYDQYVKTIGVLESSYVIKQFVSVCKTEYVIMYLEELHKNQNDLIGPHHTALLLNCLLKEKSIKKF